MPAEPNPNVEKELQAFAAQRRSQARSPFTLPSAVRRLLQEEVRRTGIGPEAAVSGATHLGWWRAFWPRLALAGGLGIVLLLALLQFVPMQRQATYELARALDPAGPPATTPSEDDQSTASLQTRTEAATPAVQVRSAVPIEPAPDSTVSQLRESSSEAASSVRTARGEEFAGRDTDRLAADAGSAPDAPASAPIARPSTATARAPDPSADRLLRQRYGTAPGRGADRSVQPFAEALAAEPKQVAALEMEKSGAVPDRRPAPTPALARSRAADASNGSIHPAATIAEKTQQFTQVDRYRRNFNSPARPDVLQSFRLIASQEQLVIEDADGSVYRGAIRSDPGAVAPGDALSTETADLKRAEAAPGAVATPALAPGAEGDSQPAWVGFVVVGTNLTLQQRVVFTGQFTVAPGLGAANREESPGGLAGRGEPEAGAGAWFYSQAVRSPATSSIPGFVSPSRVRGQATVGTTVRLEIDAVPARP